MGGTAIVGILLLAMNCLSMKQCEDPELSSVHKDREMRELSDQHKESRGRKEWMR